MRRTVFSELVWNSERTVFLAANGREPSTRKKLIPFAVKSFPTMSRVRFQKLKTTLVELVLSEQKRGLNIPFLLVLVLINVFKQNLQLGRIRLLPVIFDFILTNALKHLFIMLVVLSAQLALKVLVAVVLHV